MVNKNDLLCVVCSAGGHLTEALLASAGIEYPKYLVTYKLPHMDKTLAGMEYYYIPLFRAVRISATRNHHSQYKKEYKPVSHLPV